MAPMMACAKNGGSTFAEPAKTLAREIAGLAATKAKMMNNKDDIAAKLKSLHGYVELIGDSDKETVFGECCDAMELLLKASVHPKLVCLLVRHLAKAKANAEWFGGVRAGGNKVIMEAIINMATRVNTYEDAFGALYYITLHDKARKKLVQDGFFSHDKVRAMLGIYMSRPADKQGHPIQGPQMLDMLQWLCRFVVVLKDKPSSAVAAKNRAGGGTDSPAKKRKWAS